MCDTDPTRSVRDLLTEQGNTPTLLRWNGQSLVGNVWREDPSPVGGDEVTMGTLAMQSAKGYDWDDTPTHLEIGTTVWGDYCGSTYTRSNCRSLARDFPETFVLVTGGYSSEYLALPIDAEIPEHLFDALVSLADDYPVYDESDQYELESEIESECWESYGRYDLTREILAELGEDAEDMIPSDDTLDALVYVEREDAGIYPEFEDATSCYWRDDKETAHAIAEGIITTYREVTPVQSETLI